MRKWSQVRVRLSDLALIGTYLRAFTQLGHRPEAQCAEYRPLEVATPDGVHGRVQSFTKPGRQPDGTVWLVQAGDRFAILNEVGVPSLADPSPAVAGAVAYAVARGVLDDGWLATAQVP